MTADGARPDLLNHYLRDARPTPADRLRDGAEAEARRVDAIQSLLALYRAAEPGPVQRQLRLFFRREWDRILHADDPALATKEFFEGRTRRGRQPVADDQNLEIAVAVQERRNVGMSVEAACVEAAASNGSRVGSWEQVRGIYFGSGKDQNARQRWRRAVKAEVALRAERRDSR